MRLFAIVTAATCLLACSSESDRGPAPEARFQAVTSFDPKAYELAEGLTVHDGAAYVSLAPLGSIVRVGADGQRTPYASVPAGYDKGYALGIDFDTEGNLYVLATRNVDDPAAPTPGIYKIARGGGSATTPFATDPDMKFPNGIAFDGDGSLLVTDSATGKIFHVGSDGEVDTWSDAPELQGSTECQLPLPFPIGANGIVVTPQSVVVTNTSRGALIRIERQSDGSAGSVSTLVGDCRWGGLDGLAQDSDGSFVVAQNGAPGRVLRIQPSGEVSVLYAGQAADGPASVAFAADWNGQRTLLVTSSAFFSVSMAGASPAPGLGSYGPMP